MHEAMQEPYRLDVLTRVPPKVFIPLFGVASLSLAGLGFRAATLSTGVTFMVAGYFGWTFFEYWMHRTVLHWEPSQPFLARVHWMAHGHHHDQPRDPRRLFFPLIFSIPLLALFAAGYVEVLGGARGWSFSAGFVFGYFTMDFTHFLLHRKRPRSRLGRRFHELHMRHHFDDESLGYGIGSPFWDFVFRTQSRQSHTRPRARRALTSPEQQSTAFSARSGTE